MEEYKIKKQGGKKYAYLQISINNSIQKELLILELHHDITPGTVDRFITLCNRPPGKGYKKSNFHRIIPGFMAQGGNYDPNAPAVLLNKCIYMSVFVFN